MSSAFFLHVLRHYYPPSDLESALLEPLYPPFQMSNYCINSPKNVFFGKSRSLLLLFWRWWLVRSRWQLLINGWWLPSIQFFIPAKVNCPSGQFLDSCPDSWSGSRQWLPLLWRRNIIWTWWWQRCHQWPQSWLALLCCWSWSLQPPLAIGHELCPIQRGSWRLPLSTSLSLECRQGLRTEMAPMFRDRRFLLMSVFLEAKQHYV